MIYIKNMSLKIKGKVLLEDITLTIDNGQFVCISGHNGSGKSLLFQVICGLQRCTGTVIVNNTNVSESLEVPQSIGLTLNAPEYNTSQNGLDYLIELADIRKVTSKEHIIILMKRFNLRNDNINNYSLGMKQKLGIIQATMENQQLVLLDEPYNGLDEQSVTELNDYLSELKNSGKTIVIIAHDSGVDKLLIDKYIKIENGRIIAN